MDTSDRIHLRIFSDLHLHTFGYGAGPDPSPLRNRRLLAGCEVLRQIFTAQADERDAILFGGDLFETRGLIPTAVLLQLQATLAAAQVQQSIIKPFFAVAGNHDKVASSNGESALGLLRSMIPGAIIAEAAPLVTHLAEGLLLVLLPYQSTQDGLDAQLAAVQIPRTQGVYLDHRLFLVLGHNGMALPGGDAIPGEPTYLPAALTQKFGTRIVGLFGHWHRHAASWPIQEQLVDLPLPAWIQIGAPLQHHWSDAGQPRGWVDLDCYRRDGAWVASAQFVESQAPRFRHALADHQAGDFVRVQLPHDALPPADPGDCGKLEVLFDPPPAVIPATSQPRLDDSDAAILAKYLTGADLDDATRARRHALGLELLQFAQDGGL